MSSEFGMSGGDGEGRRTGWVVGVSLGWGVGMGSRGWLVRFRIWMFISDFTLPC